MRILQVHNRYRAGRSGEDTQVDAERRMLEMHGHTVAQHMADNADVQVSGLKAVAAGLESVWSLRAARDLSVVLRDFRPDVVHVTNTFAALSPSVLWAAKKARLPVVLTLQNYRLACAASTLFRDGRPCEECLVRFPWPALIHRCQYNGSTGQAACILASQLTHRAIRTYHRKVDAFIAVTEFCRSIMVRSGLPAERVYVKPNSAAEDAAEITPVEGERPRQMLFAGRVSCEKGVDLLTEAWAAVRPEGWSLAIVGDGPERESLQRIHAKDASIRWMGRRPRTEVLEVMASSRWLVHPARWYEPFGLVIVEAMSAGTPALVPSVGSMPEIVSDGVNGLTFAPVTTDTLVRVLRKAIDAADQDWKAWSRAARQTYLTRYSLQRNYEQLMWVYERARANAQDGRGTV